MIIKTYSVPRVIKESYCRSSEDTFFSELSDYKIHSNSLMPNIPFEEANIEPYEIDPSGIFLNDEETKLTFSNMIDCQNYLTTKYVGRAPLEYYGPKTKMGRQFILICKDGDPSYQFRCFGTKDAIHGYNRNANENILLPL
jgi:hypothetical protein